MKKRLVDQHTIQGLRHVLLKARGPSQGAEEDYEKAYDFWLEMWRSTFAEVNADITLRSDTFLTQREVSAIFLHDQVIALMMYDFRDLRLKAHRDLSYFHQYPPEVLNLLASKGYDQVMTLGQMTVHPDWRRSKVGPFMSELLASISIKRFLGSTAPVMLAITRNDRGTQGLGYRFGAVPLAEGHEAYGIPSDAIVIYRDKATGSDMPGMNEIADRLWHGTRVARLFSEMPPGLAKERAENEVVVLMPGAVRVR